MHRLRSVAVMLALLGATFVVGCAKAPAPAPGVAAQTPAPSALAQIQAMTPDAKHSAIASSFPLEVPVPVGEFVRAQAQGADAWDYTVRVDATPDALVEWYRAVYASREWTLLSQAGPGYGGSGGILTFGKGNSQCQIAVDGESGGPAIARVVLGVGVPVLDQQ